MGIAFQQLAVFEGAGLTLVRVDDDIFGKNIFGYKPPFNTRGKTSATSAAKVAFGNLGDDVLRLIVFDDLAQRLVTATGDVNVQFSNIGHL
jgi:hypothetical protein